MAKFNPKMELNLTTLANSNLDSAVARKLRIVLYSTDFKILFANRIIDEIVNRTQDGIDKKGSSFVAYSKSYKSSTVFDIYGKSKQVNLTLTGSMLSSVDSIISREKIIIYFNDDEDAAKAHGHINGSNNLPKRDFFGLPPKVIDDIYKESVKDYRSGSRDESTDTTAQDILKGAEDG